jgi:glycosyltransferase involved in cell wall biosynthesis
MTVGTFKLGFLSLQDPYNRRSWSGSIYSMFHALESTVDKIEHVAIVQDGLTKFAFRCVSKMRRIMKDPANIEHSVVLSYLYGRLFRKAISNSGCDIVFAPVASMETAYLRSPVPLVYMSDATFRAIEDYYHAFAVMHPLSRWEGNHIETLAIAHADALIYSNDWAARSAVKDYGVNPEKIHVIPFGANMDSIPAREDLRVGSTDGKCRLLFVSRDWKRKGGPIAYEALLALRQRGIDAELTVVGCDPEIPLADPALRVIPFLDKNIPEQKKILADLYFDSDIFLLPTRAECSAIVFCEASAYGLPTVSTDTGGTSSVIIEGVNGSLLPPEAGGEEYAELIARLWNDPAAFKKMRQTSRARYEAVLNWSAWATGVCGVMDSLLAARQ